MTSGSTFKIVPPYEDSESEFHKKKDKKYGESSSSFELDKVESSDRTPNKKGIEYAPETKSDSKEEVKSEPDNTMTDCWINVSKIITKLV